MIAHQTTDSATVNQSSNEHSLRHDRPLTWRRLQYGRTLRCYVCRQAIRADDEALAVYFAGGNQLFAHVECGPRGVGR